jgi:tRNA(Ile)-lysidine synthetase-like protein
MNFAYVLEHVDFESDIKTYDTSHELIEHVSQFCGNEKKFIVSLSGGVDSMVITSILKLLGKTVICCHINYKNRLESDTEASFLRSWVKNNDMMFICRTLDMTRSSVARKVYEEKSREERFKVYKDVLQISKAFCVCLGHHDDDIIENVFNNFCKGRDILDLPVMSELSPIDGVLLGRPLLGIRKDLVYDFATKNKVPYFKDTTPDWSVRGKFRRRALPLIKNMHNGVEQNLLNICRQSQEYNKLLSQFVVDPFLCSHVKFSENKAVVNFENHDSIGFIFWKRILTILFHNFKVTMPSLKNMNIFHKLVTSNATKKCNLGKHVTAEFFGNKTFTLGFNL